MRLYASCYNASDGCAHDNHIATKLNLVLLRLNLMIVKRFGQNYTGFVVKLGMPFWQVCSTVRTSRILVLVRISGVGLL